MSKKSEKRKMHVIHINNLYRLRDRYKKFSQEWCEYSYDIVESKKMYYKLFVNQST